MPEPHPSSTHGRPKRPEVTLRKLELSDLDAIERIEKASYPAPWSRSMFVSELAKPSSLSLGAVGAKSELAGYLIVSRYVDAWHVMNVAVAPGYRRHGIASALLERLFDVTRDDARRGYTLEVRVSNVAAIRLYERFGFSSHGVRPGYYTDNREDALIMWRDADQRDAGEKDAGDKDAEKPDAEKPDAEKPDAGQRDDESQPEEPTE
jgi:ribosomal-protein-alanine N-acetyltransferase